MSDAKTKNEIYDYFVKYQRPTMEEGFTAEIINVPFVFVDHN